MIDEVAVRREGASVEQATRELAAEQAILKGLPTDADPLEIGRRELSVAMAEGNLAGARRRLEDARRGWTPDPQMDESELEQVA